MFQILYKKKNKQPTNRRGREREWEKRDKCSSFRRGESERERRRKGQIVRKGRKRRGEEE